MGRVARAILAWLAPGAARTLNISDFAKAFRQVGDHSKCSHDPSPYRRQLLRFIFEDLGAHRASPEYDDTNVRSWQVAERCGMQKEGHCQENNEHADDTLTGTFYY